MKTITNNITNTIFRFFLDPYIIPFIISLLLVAFYIFPLPDLLSGGGDAQSIWQTIISFGDDTITSSYVLYKGFLSVYPYVWFYNWAISIDQDPFVYIKIYHSLLFAYVSAIGVPYVISNLLSIKLKLYRNIIFVCILFYMFKFTHIFNMLMIDLPSWTFFVAAISSVLKLSKMNYHHHKFYFLYSGCLVGLTLCASGQYSVAGYLLIIYIVYTMLMQNKLKQIIINKNIILALLILILGVVTPKAYDADFEKTIVQPMRDRGDWLPTGEEWLLSGMTRMLPHYKFGYHESSNRGLAILKKTEGDNFAQRYDIIKQGGGAYSIKEYLHILQNNVFDFIVMWGTKTFISISFDGGKAKISHLLISYIALFLCLHLLHRKCKKVKDLLSSKSIIVLAIVSTIAAPVFLFVEMRYIITLQSFIIGFALLDDHIWNSINQYKNRIIIIIQKREFNACINCTISYSWVVFTIYLLFCFLLYGALLEIPGSNPDKVLFRL
jgi:hypothetical protein